MKILFLTDNFPPEVNAPATRTFEHAEEWVKAGVDVTIITCNPNFPQGKIYKGFQNNLRKVEYINGIRVIRVWTYITANEGFMKRTLDYLSFAFMASLVGLFEKSDLIIATSPQFFTTWAGWILSKLKRKPWIFELRDLWPDTIEAVGAINNKTILKFLESVELYLYRSSTAVVAVTDYFKQNLVERGIDENKIKVVTNGTNLCQFQPQKKNHKLLRLYNLENKFIIGYVGTHGLTHGLDFILECANDLDIGVHFLFLGDGAEKIKLKKIAKEFSLTNITFLDPVSKEEVSNYISLFDVSLVPLKRKDVFRTVIPSKIFEQASMMKPILLGVDGQAREIVENYNAGLFYKPEDKASFMTQLDRLRTDEELYKELQIGCSKLAKDYDRKIKAKEMCNFLKNIV